MSTAAEGPTEGQRRAEEHLALAAAGDTEGAQRVLDEAVDLPAMTYLGAAFTAVSRGGARELSPAQRAQATGRHMRISALRDSARRDPEALRTWLAASAAEAVFVRQMQANTAVRAAGTA